MAAMTPIKHIRRNILGLTQVELAALTGADQSTVSRWDNGLSFPNQNEMAKIRAKAMNSGKDWDDRWFFEVGPTPAVAEIQQPSE